MPEQVALSKDEINKRIKDFQDWVVENNTLVFKKKFNEYLDGIEFVSQLGRAAENNDHHPDIQINYRTVTVKYSTHSAGGITDLDFKMARVVEDLLASFSR